MSLFPSADAKRTRIHLTNEELSKYARLSMTDEQKIRDIVTILDGGGLNILKENVIRRFATEITKQSTGQDASQIEIDAEAGTEGWKTKRDIAASLAISEGMHTISSLFGFRRVVFNRATLFSNPGQYTYSKDPGSWLQDFVDDRRTALHDRRMSRLDLLATGIGSCACYVSGDARGYRYNVFDPTKIWVVHNDKLLVDDQEVDVDRLSIDDATVVVMLNGYSTNASGETVGKYLAYFGRSDIYPEGRMVRYESHGWHDIPDPGNGGWDYTTSSVTQTPGGEYANPLTLYSDQTNNQSSVEYPIINWQMDKTADGTCIFPVSGSFLFDNMFEIDTEFSRNMESGGRSGRGAWLGKDPRSLGWAKSISEGEYIGKKEQEVTLLSHPASNAKTASEINIAALEQAAGAYNVPAYKVSTKSDLQASSGFALRVMDAPLQQDRQDRATINRASMARKFQIEKAWINYLYGENKINDDTVEYWEPGEIDTLETGEEQRAQTDWELANGLRSVVDLFIDINKIENRDEAINRLDEIKSENQQYLKSSQQQSANTGTIFRRNQAGQ